MDGFSPIHFKNHFGDGGSYCLTNINYVTNAVTSKITPQKKKVLKNLVYHYPLVI